MDAREDITPLFDQAQPTEALQKIIHYLQQIANEQIRTQQQTAQLAQLELIQPWSMRQEHSTLPEIDGFYTLNLEKLNQLDATTLQKLQHSGALQLATLQHASLARFKDLIYRHNQLKDQEQSPKAQDIDLDQGDTSG